MKSIRNCLLVSWSFLSLGMSALAAPTDTPSAASFYVRGLPGLSTDPTRPLHMYAGHISSDPEESKLPASTVTAHLFFVLVKARRLADKERILFWFNGGPGCSSMDGFMMETGPFRVDGKGGLRMIDGGWEEYTNMVFVDQPAGTGFSYVSTDRFVHDIKTGAQQVVEFMRNFYKIFPEYKSMDTYIGGESYAGQYIPYIGDAILSSDLHQPLKGLAIGNGWIDARRQYPAYLEYALKHSIIEENSDIYRRVKETTDVCVETMNKINTEEPISLSRCERLVSMISESQQMERQDGEQMCMNVYDVRKYDTLPACGMNWPEDLSEATNYLDRKDVKAALNANAKSESWVECNGRIGGEITNRGVSSSVTLLPSLLEKIPIMLFAGDQDFICNYVGIENLISALSWNGQQGLGTVETKSWSVDGTPAGTWVESRNLSYVKIFNASHMVPYDVPHVAHDMILRFMGMNFSAITDGSARIPSKVGNEEKPIPTTVDGDKDANTNPIPVGKTPEQDKAMWEAYYNAGSAALVLLLIGLAIGLFLFFRRRRHGISLLSREESIPLNESSSVEQIPLMNGNGAHDEDNNDGKGKGRLKDDDIVFEVGSDDEEDRRDKL
ncbi:KEX1 protein [Schizopora paradoxa]|uniref:Carboxypeptidase n=1 Tax=Schizopora paradoxa TaxID=27342 RepID=A0A0H2RUN6_9AGAM|nr:KEX1 protein [Schizopora paradoxa]